MYIALKQGLTTTWGRNFVSTGTSCHFSHLLQVSKNLFDVCHNIFFFMILYIYIAPRQGTKFWCQQQYRHFIHLLQVSKKMSLKSDFIQFFFMILVYSPGAGADSPQGTKFWCQQKGHITLPIFASFKEISEVWFYLIFSWFNSPGAEGIQPPGDKVLMSTETSCHFSHLLLASNHRRQ